MRNTKKILTTTLTLVLMVVVLGTGVFAWFTINTKTSATGLSGTAEAADGGFYIRLGGSEKPWTDSLDLSDIANNANKILLKDITSEDGVSFRNLDKTTANNDKYIEFDLDFITGSKFNVVHLEKLNIKSEDSSWVSEIDVVGTGLNNYKNNISRGYIMKAKLADAIRVSLVDKEKSADALIVENTGADQDVDVDVTVADKVATFNNTTGFGGFALAYYNLINDIELDSDNETYPLNRGDITTDQIGPDNNNPLSKAETELNDEQYVTFDGGKTTTKLDGSFKYTTTITVRVWLEGWDKEAFNAVSSGTVNLDFVFRAKEDITEVETDPEPQLIN